MHDRALRLHHAVLPDADVSQHTGFRVTNPVRTIIDIAAAFSADEDQLARLIDEALRRGVVSIRSLRSRAEMIDARGALYVERALQWTDA